MCFNQCPFVGWFDLHKDYLEDLYETLMADESQPRTDCVNVGADPDEGMDPGTGSYTL